MHSKLVAAACTLFLTASRATTVSFYSSTDCTGDRIGQYSGSGANPDDGFEFDVNADVGSMYWDQGEPYSQQLNADDGCIFTTVTCCQYAPDCKLGVVNDADCVTDINAHIGHGGMSSIVCDSLCIDTGY
ncbi:hypothetical protein GE09DRAFT_1066533 [Coniochaeta sp. 2T2.1]|nr:hypothetical protein GE09DRAFT_1066533 [Coniochaeta sp. 2T2.1]